MNSASGQPGPTDTPSRNSTYPYADRQPVLDVLHGVEVPDPYRWLEDPDSTATQAWAKAQDRLLAEHKSQWNTRDHFARRVRELLEGGVHGLPVWRQDRCFFMRRDPGQEHGVIYAQDDATSAEPSAPRALIDPMQLDNTGLTTLDSWQPCKQGRYVAYQISAAGREESVLWVLDASTGEIVDGPIDRARYSPVAWSEDSSGFFYVRRLAPEQLPEDQQQYHRRVWWHELGADPDTDTEVFGSGRDYRDYYGVSLSLNGRWLIASGSTGTSPANDLYIADLGTDPAERAQRRLSPVFQPVIEGVDAATHGWVGRDDRLYLFTDLDATRGKLCVTDPSTPSQEHWADLIGEDEVSVLKNVAILDGDDLEAPVLAATWTTHAISQLSLHTLPTQGPAEQIGSIDLGIGSLGGLSTRPEGGSKFWISFTSYTQPTQIHQVDVAAHLRGEDSVMLFAQAPSQVQVPEVHTQQIAYTSLDGTTVHMFVMSPAGRTRGADGPPLPTTLYGYGGFGASMTPGYSASILSWVEAGGVYAVAGLRGGGEEGEAWHRDGMLGNKQNVYDDFHSAAQWLIDQGWSTPEKLVISGGSNGGLLVGAALTQRPDLFRAVICSAPLLDMVRYELFGLGATWNTEYGSAEVPEEFGWLHGYSPYHRVAEGTAYPAVLFTVFDGDTRVDPLHARKLCAALQHATSSDPATHPVLIRAEANVGHGARSLSRSIELSADTLSFTAQMSGLSAP